LTRSVPPPGRKRLSFLSAPAAKGRSHLFVSPFFSPFLSVLKASSSSLGASLSPSYSNEFFFPHALQNIGSRSAGQPSGDRKNQVFLSLLSERSSPFSDGLLFSLQVYLVVGVFVPPVVSSS